MRRSDNEMFAAVDKSGLFYGIGSPEYEYSFAAAGTYRFDDRIGKPFPAESGMTSGSMSVH